MIKVLAAKGLRMGAIASQLGIGKGSVHRALSGVKPNGELATSFALVLAVMAAPLWR